jgi:hypothetical protein
VFSKAFELEKEHLVSIFELLPGGIVKIMLQGENTVGSVKLAFKPLKSSK